MLQRNRPFFYSFQFFILLNCSFWKPGTISKHFSAAWLHRLISVNWNSPSMNHLICYRFVAIFSAQFKRSQSRFLVSEAVKVWHQGRDYLSSVTSMKRSAVRKSRFHWFIHWFLLRAVFIITTIMEFYRDYSRRWSWVLKDMAFLWCYNTAEKSWNRIDKLKVLCCLCKTKQCRESRSAALEETKRLNSLIPKYSINYHLKQGCVCVCVCALMKEESFNKRTGQK